MWPPVHSILLFVEERSQELLVCFLEGAMATSPFHNLRMAPGSIFEISADTRQWGLVLQIIARMDKPVPWAELDLPEGT